MNRKNKIIRALLPTLVIIVLVALGGKVYMNHKENENIAKQRTAAIAFKGIQPGIERIKFNESGSYSGAGIWSVGVSILINGKTYKEILAQDGIGGGNTLPGPDKNVATKSPIKVIYSNGQEEILN